MTDYYLSICLPLAYTAMALTVAKAAAPGVKQAVRNDNGPHRTEDLVLGGLFTLIIGGLWPLACLVWLVLPKDPETGRKFPA